MSAIRPTERTERYKEHAEFIEFEYVHELNAEPQRHTFWRIRVSGIEERNQDGTRIEYESLEACRAEIDRRLKKS